MDFNADLTKFPSVLHSHIYSAGRSIMPLSHTLNAVADPAMGESCMALHGFVTNMLSDMYDNPEEYYFPVMKLEEFLDGKDINEVKKQFTAKIKTLLSQIEHAVPQYMDFLNRIGQDGRIEGDSFVISAESLQKIGKKFSTSVSPISLEKRLNALNRIGLMTVSSSENQIHITSAEYPGMFPAFAYGLSLGKLDFRNIKEPQKLTQDDYFYPFLSEQRKRAYELHNFAMERSLRIDASNANGQLNYKYKSAMVMSIGIERTYMRFLDVCVIGKDRAEEHTIIEKKLEKESRDFQNEALKRMSGCDSNQCIACSTYSSGNFVTIMGKKHQMCGGHVIKFQWREPVPADMAILKRLIEIRCENIDEAQGAKKAKSKKA